MKAVKRKENKKKVKPDFNRFRPGEGTRTFEHLTEEELKELKTEVNRNIFNAGFILVDRKAENVILGKYKHGTDICTFSGGIKSTECINEGALRELNEESLNCLHVDRDISKCSGFYFIMGTICYIYFFARMKEMDFEEVKKRFDEEAKRRLERRENSLEITSLVKVPIDIFVRLVNNNRTEKFGEYTLYDLPARMLKEARINIKETFQKLCTDEDSVDDKFIEDFNKFKPFSKSEKVEEFESFSKVIPE